MAQVISTNIASLNAQRNLGTTQGALQTALQRLSSGLRINSAKDDAAGLSISERFTSQINGLDQAQRNANDGVSLAQTGEGALGQMGDLLQRIRQLAVQSANGTNSASDRQSINSEVGQLVSELDRFAQTTQFNGQNLLDGSFSAVNYQVGANANQTITATSANFRTTAYGGNQELSSNVATVASGATAGPNNLYGAGTLTINGGYGSGTVNVVTTDSAKSIAANINGQTQTGVTATAQTQFDLAFTAGASYSIALTAANTSAVNVSFTATANTAAGLASAISAFNNVSGQTGVTAQLNAAGNGITLTAADGSNVNMAQTANASGVLAITATAGYTNANGLGGGVTGMPSGVGSVTVGGSITLNSDRSYSTTQAASSGLFTTGGAGVTASTLKAVNTLDVSTVVGANLAINIADAALQVVNNQRAAFGALQNRFTATIANLQTASENMSAARSRIRDADFAQETANLTRAQVLQQAGTAMLAQANALPNQVLTLLR